MSPFMETDDIIVYTRPNCGPCGATKRKLTKLGHSFIEVDTSVDEAAAQRLRDAGHTEAPVVEANGMTWTGFRPDLIDAIATPWPAAA